jgi:hypothetical protein
MFDKDCIEHFQYDEINASPKIERFHIFKQKNLEETRYEILHSNGFIKLTGPKGRLYWCNQGLCGMKNPDWKIHFAIQKEDISLAWNIIGYAFMEFGCQFGMKVQLQSNMPSYHGKSNISDDKEDALWTPEMWGREITVYIYQHHSDYDTENGRLEMEDGSTIKLLKSDEQDYKFWKTFVSTVETRLEHKGVKPVQINPGDKKFGQIYASIRNEAFVKLNPKWVIAHESCDSKNGFITEIYPPNDAGWNAAKNEYPFDKHSCILS